VPDGAIDRFAAGLTRRETLAWAGRLTVLALGAAALAACTDDGGGGGGDGEAEMLTRPVRVVLPDYPYVPGTAIDAAPRLLDALATEYATVQGNEPLDIVEFLYVSIPTTAVDLALDRDDDLSPGQLVWLWYVSGYFAGLWLRGQIAAAQPGALLTTFSAPLDAAGFMRLAARAQTGLDAAAGPADAVVAYNETSLFDTPNPADPELPYRGLVDTFGYDQGALTQMLAVPPLGVAEPEPTTTCSGILSCTHEAPMVRALAALAPVERDLNDARSGRYRELAEQIAPVQEVASARGRRAWGGEPSLSVEGFSTETYRQVIDISTSSLEQAQAGALATVQAVAERDAELGRPAAVVAAGIGAWLGGHQAGLRDGRPDREQPRFVER
jgi:hypothetical protein